MDWAKDLYHNAKNKIDGFTGSDIEKIVKEATSNENWGSSGTLKAEIAHYTFDFQGCKEVMGIVWKRLGESERNWRMVFKSLQLLEYLVKNGHERVSNMARERQFQIKMLSSFSYTDDNHIDRGKGVRELAIQITDLLSDWSKLREIRQEAKKHKKKFRGIASTSKSGGFGGYDNQSSSKWKEDWRDPGKSKSKGSKKSN
jgi:epsin